MPKINNEEIIQISQDIIPMSRNANQDLSPDNNLFFKTPDKIPGIIPKGKKKANCKIIRKREI